MGYSEIVYRLDGMVAVISFNRPDKLNALTMTTTAELRAAMFEAEADDAVRAIVLTGEGRGFSAGADMGSLSSLAGGETPDGGRAPETEGGDQTPATRDGLRRRDDIREDFAREYSYMASILKPIIAAINGPAAGLGFVIPLYCDFRLASDRARFTTAFARRGLVAEYGIGWMLPRLVGMGHALELLYSGRLIDAAEAQRIGLVNRVIEHEHFMEEVMATAAEIATRSSPRSLRVMKAQVYASQFQGLAEAYDVAISEMLESFSSQDFREGVAHWLEKREPRFTGG